jgi:PmbA protein
MQRMNDLNSNTLELSEEALASIISETLDLAKKLGATQAEAGLTVAEGMSVSARMREVETVEYQKDNGLGISVYFGRRKGSASTASLDKDSIRKTVEAACNIARYTSEDPCTGLADAALMATHFADLDLYHEWDISTDQAIQLALECEASALDYDSAISNSEGASIDVGKSHSAYGNSHGFNRVERKSRHSISCSVVASNETGMQRDYWYDVNRSPAKLLPVAEIGRKAAQRTVQRLGAVKLKTGQSPVLFAPELARGFVSHLISAIGGNAQYRKASFLLDALGSKILPGFVRLQEFPFEPGALGSANYDGEGVATNDSPLVENGVLQSYLLDSYSARKLGRVSTGHASGVHNLKVSDTGKTFEQCLQTMDKGLLLTELMGQGVNTVTGDYSRGAAGFWVENGEIQYPVEEITIAGNLKDLYLNIVDIGNDMDRRGTIHCGSILIESMIIAGQG